MVDPEYLSRQIRVSVGLAGFGRSPDVSSEFEVAPEVGIYFCFRDSEEAKGENQEYQTRLAQTCEPCERAFQQGTNSCFGEHFTHSIDLLAERY